MSRYWDYFKNTVSLVLLCIVGIVACLALGAAGIIIFFMCIGGIVYMLIMDPTEP